MPDIKLNGSAVPYSIFRRKNNKYVRISVTRRGALRVSVPWHYPNKYIPRVLTQYSEWIIKRMEEAQPGPEGDQLPVANGAPLHFLGKEYRLRYSYHQSEQATLTLREREARIHLPSAYRWSPNGDGINAFLLGWYRHQAHLYIPRRVEQLSQRMALRYAGVRLKDLRSRWGSCSAQRNLNFNIRLMMLPKRLIDYVIIHELAHLRELNHSPRFWRLVGRFCPRYEELREELKLRAALLGD